MLLTARSVRRAAGVIASALLGSATTALAQSAVVTGKVTSAQGTPIEAANAFITELAASVGTNAAGQFSITIPAERVRGQAAGPITVNVIPPWAKTDVGRVPSEEVIDFRRTHGLENQFVVMYSGNHAIQHPLTTLLDAAARLESDPRIVFVFVGGGAGKAAVEARIAAGGRNLRSLPFQPLDSLRSSLGAADVHAVSMGDEVVGIVHPCKIYGAMAVGRPILFFGPERSHGGEIVCRHSIGWTIPHGDVDETVRAIVAAAAMEPATLALMGENAAQAVASEFSPDQLRGRVCDVIEP